MNKSVLQVIIKTGIKDAQGDIIAPDAIKPNGRPSSLRLIHDQRIGSVAAAAAFAAVPNKLKAVVVNAELETLKNELEEAREKLLEASS